jgi:hypothetical protein
MDIWTRYFHPAASLVTELIATADRSKTSIATVYHQCAVFADRQYHTILRSSDAIKWKLYAERKEKEIQHRKERMLRTQSGSRIFHELKHDQEKAEKLLREDTQRYRKHNESLSTFLQQAIDMYSRCLPQLAWQSRQMIPLQVVKRHCKVSSFECAANTLSIVYIKSTVSAHPLGSHMGAGVHLPVSM